MVDSISKIDELKVRVANETGDKNGKIDAPEEWNIFEASLTYSVMTNEFTQEDVDNYKKNLSGKREYTKYERETEENYAETILKESVTKDPSILLTTVGQRLNVLVFDNSTGEFVNNPVASSLSKEVYEKITKVFNEVQKVGYNSKDDVKKLEKTVKENLKLGKENGFEKKVLKQLVKNAENHQRNKEYAEMEAAYKELVASGKDEEVAYKEMRNKYKDKGSYYKDYLKHGNLFYKATRFKRNDSTFEKETIMPDQRDVTKDAIRASESMTSKEVKEDAKNKLKKDNDWNRYTKKALKGERTPKQVINGVRSEIQAVIDRKATKNKVEYIIEHGIDAQEMQEKVESDVLRALLSSGLVKVKETYPDGTVKSYDVSVLSDIILTYVGEDYELNEQPKKYHQISEKENLAALLSVKSKLEALDESDAVNLVKLCGFREKTGVTWNWGRALLGAAIGAITGGLSALGAVGTNKKPTYDEKWLIKGDHIEVNVNIEDATAANLEELYNSARLATAGMEGASVTKLSTGIKIIVDCADNLLPIFYQGSRHILKSAAKASIIAASIGLLNGLQLEQSEIPVTSDFECLTLDEYKSFLLKKAKNKDEEKYAQILIMIASTFTKKDENGKEIWDVEGYRKFLFGDCSEKGINGRGSGLNKDELIGGLERLKEELEATPDDDENHEIHENDNENHPQPEKCKLVKEEHKPVIHTIKFGDCWEELVQAYFPTWKNCFGKMHGKGGAVQAFKRAIAVDKNGNYSEQYYQKLLAGYIPKDFRVPETLGGCERDGDEPKEVTFRQPGEGNVVGYLGSISYTTGEDGVTLTDCNGKKGRGQNVDEALSDINQNRPEGQKYTKEDIIED